jgi:hypothetical protein
MSQEFSPASIIITMAVHAHISPGGMNDRPVVGCGSETSHLVDIIIVIIIMFAICSAFQVSSTSGSPSFIRLCCPYHSPSLW